MALRRVCGHIPYYNENDGFKSVRTLWKGQKQHFLLIQPTLGTSDDTVCEANYYALNHKFDYIMPFDGKPRGLARVFISDIKLLKKSSCVFSSCANCQMIVCSQNSWNQKGEMHEN